MSFTTIFIIAGIILLLIFFLIAKLAIRWVVRVAIVGAILVAGPDHPGVIHWLGLVAVVASVTNIVSGFLITDRMLKMFKKKAETRPK